MRQVEVIHAEELGLVIRIELLDGDEVLEEGADDRRGVVEQPILEARREVIDGSGLALEGREGRIVHLRLHARKGREDLRAEGSVVDGRRERRQDVACDLREL